MKCFYTLNKYGLKLYVLHILRFVLFLTQNPKQNHIAEQRHGTHCHFGE